MTSKKASHTESGPDRNSRQATIADGVAADGFDAGGFLKSLTQQPGVYQMYGSDGAILYIGKARNLKKRVSSYFRKSGQPPKTRSLVSKIASIQVTVTHTEAEALLLEHNLIKQQRPPYNILLRDDKSFPYIFLSDHEFPRLSFHRGGKKARGKYFGPFPSAGAVRESLNFLQKVFKVRQCEDSFFRNRSRPCLQHQIDRCSAPCVRLVERSEYDEAVRHTVMFLQGKNRALNAELADQMERASGELAFEKAAALRDQIQHLQRVQAAQYIEGDVGDVDIVAAAFKAGVACVQVLFVRGGRVLGSRSYFPRLQLESSVAEILEAFIAQYYLVDSPRTPPREIITHEQLESVTAIEQVLTEKLGRKLVISHSVRSQRAKWLQLARETANQNLAGHLANRESVYQRFESLQELLDLPEMPQRLECFDISHTGGELTVASCVVFDSNGPLKSDYRRFNIEGVTASDDYGAMHQALDRRYTRLKSGEGLLPDILVIDGGKGQVKQAVEVLEELQVADVLVLGVAKGSTRKAGFEKLYRADTGREFVVSPDTPGLHLIQHIRDEAHRFAITGHKQRRAKKRNESPLQGIPGVGQKRRRELLRHFGGWREVASASVEELANVPGISEKLAENIYAAMHNE